MLMHPVQQYIAGHSLFQGLDSRHIEEISRLARLVALGRGQILALENEPCSAVYLVVSGRLRAYKMSPRAASRSSPS